MRLKWIGVLTLLAVLVAAGMSVPRWLTPLIAESGPPGVRSANAELMFVTRGSLEGNVGVVG